GRGQSLAHFGEGYPYWPVLGALSTMSRARTDVLGHLRTTAPSWLARLPELISHDEAEDLRRRTADASANRIVEEMLALLRALGPTLWVLEDLHWADAATLELVALLAQSFALDRFWMIGTLRLAEAVVGAHAITRIRRELRRRGHCREVMLAGLT